jgi:NitT/TauT family transport system permease protein
VPLFLILMGFGNLPIVVVVAIAAFFPAALSVMNATESVQQVHVSAARAMGASRLSMLRRVYLPAVMPEFDHWRPAGLRQCLARADLG